MLIICKLKTCFLHYSSKYINKKKKNNQFNKNKKYIKFKIDIFHLRQLLKLKKNLNIFFYEKKIYKEILIIKETKNLEFKKIC